MNPVQRNPAHPIELLAPARDLSCALAAINHGADAVYIGAPQFSARAAAGNSIADIARLASYAHQFFARVYVALNTLLDDRELETATSLIHQLWNCGADAVIIQDLGLLACDLPPIPLHASTQTDNRSVEKIKFLEALGFQQIVLARELSLAEIAAIRAATTVPLEFFVHGALCVSYSGRCFISETVAGRSANRGQCAQFCRHRYDLLDAHGQPLVRDRYLLSLQDLDLSALLPELLAAGISSLKIEGRLKDDNYVKNITAFYRQALDRILDGDPKLCRASSGRCHFHFTPNPVRTFQRGATDYFLRDRHNCPAGIDSPKSLGEMVGTVRQVQGREVHLDTTVQLANGDGLCFFDHQQRLVGLRVNRAAGTTIHLAVAVPELSAGTSLWRNHDAAFLRQLQASSQCRLLTATARVWSSGDGLACLLRDADGIESTVQLDTAGQPARQAGQRQRIARQMQKTGGSLLHLERVDVLVADDCYYAAATINALRRLAIARHLDKRCLDMPRPAVTRPAWNAIAVDNLTREDFPPPGNQRARQLYQNLGLREEKESKEKEQANVLMTCRYCLKNQLQLCPQRYPQARQPAEPLYLADNSGCYQLRFDCHRCEMRVEQAEQVPTRQTPARPALKRKRQR